MFADNTLYDVIDWSDTSESIVDKIQQLEAERKYYEDLCRRYHLRRYNVCG